MIDVEGANSERKNLVVLSLIIILYYFGGGHLEEGSESVNFGFVNLVFDHPEILAWFVWIALWWFAFRFFQASRETFYTAFVEMQISASNQFPLLMYLHDQFKLELGTNFERAELLTNSKDLKHPWHIRVFRKDNSTNGYKVPEKHVTYVLLASTFRLLLVRPFFGSYILPYLLFITANLSPFLS